MEHDTGSHNRIWTIIAAVILLALSAALYTAHYLLFHDVHHIAIFFVGDLAFLPLEVLIVTLVIEQLLESRERTRKREKLNMVIGLFFSTLGIPLLRFLSVHDPELGKIQKELAVHQTWAGQDFSRVRRCIQDHECTIAQGDLNLQNLQRLLVSYEEFLLRILENPMILEHESFTDLVQALFPLTEELKARPDTGALPATDIAHIFGDIRRVYSRLMLEWIDYMEYLKLHYPYLFSLAMRRNPFDENADVIVRQ